METMKFRMTHLVFDDCISTFDEESVPRWLGTGDYKYFYNKFVLKLKVGEHFDTDFQRITRIE